MNNMLRILVLVAGMATVSGAHAACFYNGKSYDTGTQVGSLVCTSSGRWKKP